MKQPKRPPIITRFVPVTPQAKKSGSRIERSFEPIRHLRTNETCSLKLHFSNAAREVVGYIEKLASIDPERFVWATVPNIVEHCKRFKSPETYSRRTVNYVLAFLREHNIISEPLYRLQRVANFDRQQLGFVVADHDNLFFRSRNRCEFVGAERSPAKYEAPTREQNARQGNENSMTVEQREELARQRTKELRKRK